MAPNKAFQIFERRRMTECGWHLTTWKSFSASVADCGGCGRGNRRLGEAAREIRGLLVIGSGLGQRISDACADDSVDLRVTLVVTELTQQVSDLFIDTTITLSELRSGWIDVTAARESLPR